MLATLTVIAVVVAGIGTIAAGVEIVAAGAGIVAAGVPALTKLNPSAWNACNRYITT